MKIGVGIFDTTFRDNYGFQRNILLTVIFFNLKKNYSVVGRNAASGASPVHFTIISFDFFIFSKSLGDTPLTTLQSSSFVRYTSYI